MNNIKQKIGKKEKKNTLIKTKTKNKSKQITNKKLKIDKFIRIKHKYIFQIGFNRCGTQALTEAFNKLGLKTIHHNFKLSPDCPRQYLALLMYINFTNPFYDNKILYNLKDYQCFLDMEFNYGNQQLIFYNYFKEMEEQNKGSTFIMNIRSCESWILSRLKLGKKIGDYYYKDITETKIKSWIEHYFDHSIKVRDYFLRNKEVKKRSRFYVLPLEYKTITELMREMGLYSGRNNIVNRVDFAKNVVLKESEKQIPDSIIKLIEEKIKIHGDPSKPEWWI